MNSITYILLSVLLLLAGTVSAQPAEDVFLNNKTLTHEEAIARYQALDSRYEQARLLEVGGTDAGRPLHVFLISADSDFDPVSLRKKGRCVLLVNNGIHAGEPEGIDACIRLSSDLLSGKNLPANTLIAIIPVYNVDGSLNRSCCSRVNQNGPEEYGFRGNARNLDLNRDFIKCDSENARSFSALFQFLQPDLFVDTHASNGADYQYVMTLIATQHNKLNPQLAQYMTGKILPYLYSSMKHSGYEMSPYVESIGRTPETGLYEFLETPRFSTGYSTLFNTIGFVTETHMWKPYKERVLSTYEFLKHLTAFAEANHAEIKRIRNGVSSATCAQQHFPLRWELDTTRHELISFRGYEARYRKSTISGLERLYYDRNAPYTRPVKYYNVYKTTLEVEKPLSYVVPQAWREVIERLKTNGVRMQRIGRDTLIQAEVYYIVNYKTSERPYEGHYLHSSVEVRKEQQQLPFFKGDYIVPVDQERNRYIVETLEPQGVDSYFAWNFFDSVLQQKEGFSDYIFEEKAEELLKNNPALLEQLKTRQKDPAFAANHAAQLNFLYRNSPYYEKTHLRYPVVRIVK
jgi:hypothetical protein